MKLWGGLSLVVIMGLLYLHLNSEPYLEPISSRSESAKAFRRTAHVKGPEGGGVSSGHRFVLGLNFWEQFNMATANMLQLICLAAQWNARTVQPYTQNSRLYGLKHFRPDDKNIDNPSAPLDLNLIYDIASLNGVLGRYSLPELARFSDFLYHANRDLIVIHFVAEKEAHEIPIMTGRVGEVLRQSFKKEGIVDCKTLLSEFTRRIYQALTVETSAAQVDPFRISKYFCVNMSHLSTPEQLASKIGFDPAESFSIVVINWRGTSDKPFISSSATGRHLNNRILMANTCHTEIQPTDENIIAHSSTVISAARKYLEYLDLGEYIAIHVRSEKLGLREPRMPGGTKQCFLEGLRIKDAIQATTANLSTLLIADYGPYSSDTCKACRARRTMEKILEQHEMTPVSYDPTLMGDPTDSGFAAAVEMNLLARSRYLILIGGGAFQNQAALRLVKVHEGDFRDMGVFHVCTDDRGVKKVLATA